jgi:chemotaxis protein methyltransferase CheR
MVLHEFARKNSVLPLQCTEITGTDISSTVLFLAVAGRYDQIAMSRGMPQDIRDRYFVNSGKLWVLNDKIRKMVTYKKLNLQDNLSSLGKFDIVFCRNVMIYFSDAFKRELFSRFVSILNPGGILFLGASESVSNYSDKFTMVTNNRHIYYQLGKDGLK